MADYLFAATIPSVGKIINASRKTEDIWAGSLLISYLIKKSALQVRSEYDAKTEFIFPSDDIDLKRLDFADIPNKLLFKIKESSDEDVRQIAKKVDETIKNNLKELIQFALKELDIEQTNFHDLALYQSENMLELFWAASKIESDYKNTRRNLDGYVGYLKDAKIRNDGTFQSNTIIEYKSPKVSFEEFQKKEDYLEYCGGVYTCTICKENTIIGASIDDYKGKAFWENIWNRENRKIKNGERLCGFCLIKRFLAAKLKIGGFPSTSEIASTLFKKELLTKKEIMHSLIPLYHKVIDKIPKGNMVRKLKSELDNNQAEERIKSLLQMDGEWFIVDIWKNPINYKEHKIADDEAKEIVEKLEEFYKNSIFPSESYAVLKLDGDNMGAKISRLDMEDHKLLSRCQSTFVGQVEDIIKNYYGASIYIGGDDVLAMLPVKNALDCAREIRDEFQKAMSDIKKLLPDDEIYNFTLSGALLIAHHLLPLQYVLAELNGLEKKAKNMEGKDSIGIKFIKHSLSSDEIILKWNRHYSFKELSKIPKSFIYQLGSLSQVLKEEGGINHPKAREAVIIGLLKRKIGSEVEKTMDTLREIEDELNFDRIKSILRIAAVIQRG